MRKFGFVAIIAGAMVCLAACGGATEQDCELKRPPSDEPFERLSEYCFFDGKPAQQASSLSEGVVPYGVRSKLYSDHSDKFRFIVLPDGETIDYKESEMWSFPDGTIIIKTFYYPHDARNPSAGRRLLETRLMIKWDGQWHPQVYLWNDEQSKATRHLIGKDRQVQWIDEQGDERSVNYRVPGVNDCGSCHAVNNQIELLGPRTRQLNREFNYAEGTHNQLEFFDDKGMLSPGLEKAPAELPKLADPKDESLSIETRARAYLEGNCAHCHSPKGPASNSGLFLGVEIEDRRQLGICKQPIAAGGGTGGFEYDIKPGIPEESIMVYRMSSSEPGVKMPELPLRTVDEFGVSVVSEWISQMEPTGCPQ